MNHQHGWHLEELSGLPGLLSETGPCQAVSAEAHQLPGFPVQSPALPVGAHPFPAKVAVNLHPLKTGPTEEDANYRGAGSFLPVDTGPGPMTIMTQRI